MERYPLDDLADIFLSHFRFAEQPELREWNELTKRVRKCRPNQVLDFRQALKTAAKYFFQDAGTVVLNRLEEELETKGLLDSEWKRGLHQIRMRLTYLPKFVSRLWQKRRKAKLA